VVLQTIRDSIVGLVSSAYPAAYPAVPIYYDNQQIDLNNQGAQFCTFEIEFYAGTQIGAQVDPRTRVAGYVYVTMHTRDGQGSRTGLGILDWFSTTLGYKSPGTVRLQAPEPAGSDTVSGWYVQELKVPFYADPA
jgi:hypothetical protein